MRGLKGPFPETLGFLPAHGRHKPAMIAAFGIPQEPEPGVLEIIPGAVTGIHLTRLLPDGSGKDESDGKPAAYRAEADLVFVISSSSCPLNAK